MWKTASLLIFTLILVPFLAFKFDVPPTDLQWDILSYTGAVYLFFALLCFIISTITKNDSQVDKLWSILPVVYGWMTYALAPEPRVLIMAILITVWGIRLTLNFSRRGGYRWKFWKGEEDYRWAVLRSKPEFQPRWKWVLFNFFFISLYQMGLIWMMTIPTIKSVGGRSICWIDYLLAVITLGFIVIETVADNQQWKYQNEKHKRLKEEKLLVDHYAKGFTHTGLWGIVRHPNYMAEQAIWIMIYLFSIVATGTWINWSIAGCLLLVLLFKGSSDFSEEISASKYPAYKDYQREVPRFIAKIPFL